MVYYGLSLNSTDFGLNVYLDFFLVVSADIVGIGICYYTVERWGRVITICVSMIIGGALCISTGWMGMLRKTQLPQKESIPRLSKFTLF